MTRVLNFAAGCHLSNTSEAALFQIVSESGIAAGVRRIEAVTGHEVLKRLQELNDFSMLVCGLLKSSRQDVSC